MEIKQNALSNQRVKKIKSKIKFKKYFETDKNGNISYQNVWDEAKGVLRKSFIVINTHTKKKEIFQIFAKIIVVLWLFIMLRYYTVVSFLLSYW